MERAPTATLARPTGRGQAHHRNLPRAVGHQPAAACPRPGLEHPAGHLLWPRGGHQTQQRRGLHIPLHLGRRHNGAELCPGRLRCLHLLRAAALLAPPRAAGCPRTTRAPWHAVITSACSFGIIMRYTRNGVLETLTQGHVRTARAKGLSSNTILMQHTFRNALIPLVTILAA
ncbi:MAG: ABC transporter permease subunit [Anaerolineae bacterium]